MIVTSSLLAAADNAWLTRLIDQLILKKHQIMNVSFPADFVFFGLTEQTNALQNICNVVNPTFAHAHALGSHIQFNNTVRRFRGHLNELNSERT